MNEGFLQIQPEVEIYPSEKNDLLVPFEEKLRDCQSHEDSFSGHHEYLYNISWQSIQ